MGWVILLSFSALGLKVFLPSMEIIYLFSVMA